MARRGLDHVLARRREEEQVDVVGREALGGQQLLGGRDGEVGRVPVVGEHVDLAHAREARDHRHARRRARVARRERALRLAHVDHALGQVDPDGGDHRRRTHGSGPGATGWDGFSGTRDTVAKQTPSDGGRPQVPMG